MTGAVPHQYNYRRCRCHQCRTIGYHQSGRVTRLLARGDVPTVSAAYMWGYDFDWDKGRSVCLRCRAVLKECKCPPMWALQAGLA